MVSGPYQRYASLYDAEAPRGELSKHLRIHVCGVYPTFVDTPGIGHAAKYTGAKLSPPPGALAPEPVANAAVRLAGRPRNTTAPDAPTSARKHSLFFAPNLDATIMSGFMNSWIAKANPADDGCGALFGPPAVPGGIDGCRCRPNQRGEAAPTAASIGVSSIALAALRAFLRQLKY